MTSEGKPAADGWMRNVPIATIQKWLSHSNVSQTSTYLADASTSEHDAMARDEALCNARATDAETGVRKRQPATERHDETPNETADGHGTHIM